MELIESLQNVNYIVILVIYMIKSSLTLISILKNVIRQKDMNSLFEISQKRPEFDHLSGNESLEYNSDSDEFVLI